MTLANQLHVGRNICLSELILAGLYESLGEASSRLKEFEPQTNILLDGPYWLLQLWLNATFEPSLSTYNTINEADPEVENRTIEGTRLVRLTSDEGGKNLQECFTRNLMMFVRRHKYTPSMAPFAARSHGPEWFTRPLLNLSTKQQVESLQIWEAFLTPRLLLTRIMPKKTQNILLTYQPNFVARQFGLFQILPEPLYHNKSGIFHRGMNFNNVEAQSTIRKFTGLFHITSVPFTP